MLNFKLGWPSALRSSTSSASLSASASASSDQSPASPSSSSTLARSNSTASLKKKTPAPGIPASVRYFAIFDPRPPPSPPQDKGKGKQRAVEDDNVEQQEAGGAGEEPPSTTVLFYSSPSEPTTTQTTIQRRLGLASAIVQFTTDLSGQSQKRSHTFSDPRTWQRWSVTASKTRTLTLRVRPALYLHVVIELPRLPRSATLKSKDKSGGTVRSSVKWEYVGNAVVDEPIVEAMVKAWNAFVERCGEPPDRYTQQDSDQTKPEQARPAKASRREGDEDDDDDEGDEEARFHRALEKYFMPWVSTFDIASISFPAPPAPPPTSSTSSRPHSRTASISSTLRGSTIGYQARAPSALRKSVIGDQGNDANERTDEAASKEGTAGTDGEKKDPEAPPRTRPFSTSSATASASVLTAALAETLRLRSAASTTSSRQS